MPVESDLAYFVDHALKELHRQGIYVETTRHAASLVFPKWNMMTDNQKEQYRWIADLSRKVSRELGVREELPTRTCIADEPHTKVKLLSEREYQVKVALGCWKDLSLSQLLQKVFYFVSFQSYFDFPDPEVFRPVEIAVVGYSLSLGIMKEFHAIINPGSIEFEKEKRPMMLSENINQIPTFAFNPGRQDYDKLWKELLEFVKPEPEIDFPPLFSKISELDKNRACLDYLAMLGNEPNRLENVHQWEGLVSALHEAVGVNSPSIDEIKVGVETTDYDEEANIKCHFHEGIDRTYCAMQVIKRCCFWLRDSSIMTNNIAESNLPLGKSSHFRAVQAKFSGVKEHRTKEQSINSIMSTQSMKKLSETIEPNFYQASEFKPNGSEEVNSENDDSWNNQGASNRYDISETKFIMESSYAVAYRDDDNKSAVSDESLVPQVRHHKPNSSVALYEENIQTSEEQIDSLPSAGPSLLAGDSLASESADGAKLGPISYAQVDPVDVEFIIMRQLEIVAIRSREIKRGNTSGSCGDGQNVVGAHPPNFPEGEQCLNETPPENVTEDKE